jgi:hypothetical protein
VILWGGEVGGKLYVSAYVCAPYNLVLYRALCSNNQRKHNMKIQTHRYTNTYTRLRTYSRTPLASPASPATIFGINAAGYPQATFSWRCRGRLFGSSTISLYFLRTDEEPAGRCKTIGDPPRSLILRGRIPSTGVINIRLYTLFT